MKAVLGLAILAHSVCAWLPGIDRDLDAFNTTHVYAQLQERERILPRSANSTRHGNNTTQLFTPTLPSGVRKIRGVNFGGTWKTSCIGKPILTLCTRLADLGTMDDAKRMV